MQRWTHSREDSLRTRYRKCPESGSSDAAACRRLRRPPRGLIVLFIIRLDKRFGDPGNKEESGRANGTRKKKGRGRSTTIRPRNPGIRRVFDSPAFGFCEILSHARWPRRCALQRVQDDVVDETAKSAFFLLCAQRPHVNLSRRNRCVSSSSNLTWYRRDLNRVTHKWNEAFIRIKLFYSLSKTGLLYLNLRELWWCDSNKFVYWCLKIIERGFMRIIFNAAINCY